MPLFRAPVRVHWADTDAAGVAWFGAFFRFFEEAEAALFLSLGHNRAALMRDLGVLMPRVEASCSFRAPARPEQLLEVGVDVEEVSARRIGYRFEARDAATDRLLAEGRYRVACVDATGFQAVEVPAAVRSLLDRARTAGSGPSRREDVP